MSVIDDLTNFERALKWQENLYLPGLIHSARLQIEKLEADKRVLRWALEKAYIALAGQEINDITRSAMATLESAKMVTEPANDR